MLYALLPFSDLSTLMLIITSRAILLNRERLASTLTYAVDKYDGALH
jgi:hypothetical protein